MRKKLDDDEMIVFFIGLTRICIHEGTIANNTSIAVDMRFGSR